MGYCDDLHSNIFKLILLASGIIKMIERNLHSNIFKLILLFNSLMATYSHDLHSNIFKLIHRTATKKLKC